MQKSIESLSMVNKHADKCAENPLTCIKDGFVLVVEGARYVHEKDCIANRSRSGTRITPFFFFLPTLDAHINYRPFENPDGILRIYICRFGYEQRNIGDDDRHSLLLVASRSMALTCHSILYAAI